MNSALNVKKILYRRGSKADLPALENLMQVSFSELGTGFYSPAEIMAALEQLAKIDPILLKDKTLFVAELNQRIVGCGGWSNRTGLIETVGNESARSNSRVAAIRSFFVAPDMARRGIATAIFCLCAADARKAGCKKLEVLAAASSKALFEKLGFTHTAEETLKIGAGSALVSYRMEQFI